jgi:hypothetical protein
MFNTYSKNWICETQISWRISDKSGPNVPEISVCACSFFFPLQNCTGPLQSKLCIELCMQIHQVIGNSDVCVVCNWWMYLENVGFESDTRTV